MKIHLALPNQGTFHQGSLVGVVAATRKHVVELDPRACGCLAHNFNMCFCAALNARQTKGITHFAMLHSDIVPDHYWLDTLIEELETHHADVMSALIPLKDHRGLTSCGLGQIDTWDVKRFTLAELHGGMPKTFDIDDIGDRSDQYLAANVGAFVCRFDGSWEEDFAERGGFRVLTTIRKYPDGNHRASFYPDDWDFSRWAHLNHLKVMCTTKHGFDHIGQQVYTSRAAWGIETTDPDPFVSIPFEPYPE